MSSLQNYLAEIQKHFSDTNSSEYTYRTVFENFLKGVFVDDRIQEVKHESSTGDSNKPDFIILENKIPNLYIECKDVPIDLDKTEKSEQAARYFGYENLIITNYVEFRFYRRGKKYCEPIHLGTIDRKNRVISEVFADNTDILKRTIADFFRSNKEPIQSGKHLAGIMGGTAIRIRENIIEILKKDATSSADELNKMMGYLRETLIADLNVENFADMYAQTLVYGLFAARYNDETLENFSRAEARDLVPKTNPLLKDFFTHIALDRFPKSLAMIVDELCEVFSHANIPKLLADFYEKEKDDKDPIIHFYEDFLHEYDRKKKMEMGVFYTPEPVVGFIVRGVDELLKTEFGIHKGLADSSKTKVKLREKITEEREKIVEKELHKVQILDVATGTGTFLDMVIRHIHKSYKNQDGMWESYVDENLIPRLHGFELMMASYTIAHLKLGITLNKLGIKDPKNRLGVYLTNTLEKIQKSVQQMNLFGVTETIAKENQIAGKIKNDLPIMCVIGNPPYSGISMNKFYTDNDVYKVEPGGKQKLQERKHWLDDDYVKFIRYGESLIEKNENGGIVAMITAHGYIENPTFRGMRWHLRRTFDKIYVVDLHGNSRKKETCPDGSTDQNVFDIMSGVSIVFGIKKQKGESSKKLADVYVTDMWGKRKQKFTKLDTSSIQNITWQKLPADCDIWRKEGEGKKEYKEAFSIMEIFPENTTGIVTGIDRLSIFQTKKELKETTGKILNATDPYTEFGIKDGRKNKKEERLAELREAAEKTPVPISYRPFDTRYMYYTSGSEVWINSPRPKIMQHFIYRENIGIIAGRQVTDDSWSHVQASKYIIDNRYHFSAKGISSAFPLYLYYEDGTTDKYIKTPNISADIWRQINVVVGETTPENILDYIYCVLHSPTYRKKFAEFLKQDFPRIPYPKTKEMFWDLVPLGEKLRKLHLMEDSSVEDTITTFPVAGDNVVEKIKHEDGNVYINAEQFFGEVSDSAWNFYIGGYQPAQKWLKDRKNKTLSSDDIMHYQKIIKVLSETGKIMEKIDEMVFDLYGLTEEERGVVLES
jgi:predicted helicase